MSALKHAPSNSNAPGMGELTKQFASLKDELQEIKATQDKTAKMIATIGPRGGVGEDSKQQEITAKMLESISTPPELQDIIQQQDKMYKMIESIATSQNDLETNVYKAFMKLYTKVEQMSKSSKSVSSGGSAKGKCLTILFLIPVYHNILNIERDVSPISFRHRSNLP